MKERRVLRDLRGSVPPPSNLPAVHDKPSWIGSRMPRAKIGSSFFEGIVSRTDRLFDWTDDGMLRSDYE